MICAETRRLIDAYVDNELDLRGALEVEEHIARCPACGAEERALRELQASARANLTRYSMSPELEARLRALLQVEEPPAPAASGNSSTARVARRALRAWKWAALAPLAAAAAVLFAVGPGLWPRRSEAVEDAVIAAHVRSLLANHLTDVASSDQHTVKPWFQGKLDYSVSVTDWAAEGFPLVGGRLDYVEDTPAAALVYKRAQHVINLFVWPSKGERASSDEPVRRLCRRGYCAYRWSKEGMRYWAVSDVNDADLKTFVELARREH
ncbi:MAG: anti-sigma factor [Deltaproteobacteria bacterium]|nr:MAG: anti-sigma factor [Deltaproteobacteria bacterium]